MREDKFQENAGIYCHEVAAPPPQVDSGAAAEAGAPAAGSAAQSVGALWAAQSSVTCNN